MNIKPTKRGIEAFNYYAQCQDEKTLTPVQFDAEGYSALECFYAKETYGKDLPCREPVLLTRALNGKSWHGVTVKNCAEDFVGRVFFTSDLKNYPTWIQKEILSLAKKIATEQLGFVPTFIQTGKDFTTTD